MKSPLFARLLVLTAALAIAVTPACRRKVKGPITNLPSRAGQIGNPSAGPGDLDTSGLGGPSTIQGSDLGGAGAGVSPNSNIPLSGEPLSRDRYDADRGQFGANTVLFDFDSAVIKSSEKGKVTAVADYLRSTPSAAIEVEGHCDERGTEEYNRSLGDRRALAVREEIALQGIDPRRVFTISFGEDKPAVDGHNESAWSRNRRAEIVLLTPRP